MRSVIKFVVVIACLSVLAPIGGALAKPAGKVYSQKLPSNLTTNEDWLDDGASRDMRPNADDNDRYFLEQENFANNDPGRYSEMGSYLDNFPGQGLYY